MGSTNKRFEGKVAAVTGGGSGIGLEVAKRFVAEGGTVVINGRSEDKLKEAAKLIDPSGAKVSILAGDIGDPKIAYALVELAEARGGIDVLFNNAGIFKPKSFLEVDEEEYDKFLKIILKGKFFAAQATAKAMKARGKGGVILHTGSLWAIQAIGATPSAAYSAANAGVHALVRNLALELAGDKIRVNGVAPAVVETPVYGTFLPEDKIDETLQSFNAFHPIGRNGKPEDVAETLLFLASDKASWITGTVINVDGGVTAGRN